MNAKDFKLCYVDGKEPVAYFTEIPLDLQTGDDWNDAPYEHNAGTPYTDHYVGPAKTRTPHRVVSVFFQADYLQTPCYSQTNSRWCVNDINAKKVAWLSTASYADKQVIIHAGTTLETFVRLIESIGGAVLATRQLWAELMPPPTLMKPPEDICGSRAPDMNNPNGPCTKRAHHTDLCTWAT